MSPPAGFASHLNRFEQLVNLDLGRKNKFELHPPRSLWCHCNRGARVAEKNPETKDLFEQILDHSDMPREPLERELSELLSKAQISRGELSLDDLRKLVADYLRDVFVQAKEDMKDGVEIAEQ